MSNVIKFKFTGAIGKNKQIKKDLQTIFLGNIETTVDEMGIFIYTYIGEGRKEDILKKVLKYHKNNRNLYEIDKVLII